MPVSEHERRHFALIAAAMAEEKDEQIRDALQTTPAARVLTGFLLGAVPRPRGVAAALNDRAEGQIGLAQAAQRLRRR